MASAYSYTYFGAPPTTKDLEVLSKHLPEMEKQFKKMFIQSPPRIVFNEPSISNPKINAAYFPDSNTVTFKTGRTLPESVRHEFFHAAQKFYLGESTCVLPNEVILGDNIEISRVMPGSLAIGAGAIARRVKEVHHRFYKGLMVTIKALGCLPMIVTPEHPILIAQVDFKHLYPKTSGGHSHKVEHVVSKLKWKNASEIQNSDFLVMPKIKDESLNIPNGTTISDELAEFLGLYCAEGNSRGSMIQMSLGAHEKDLIEYVVNFFEKTFNIDPKLRRDRGAIQIRISNSKFASFLREQVGSISHNKKIPDTILYGRRSLLQAFLKGYLSGDGWEDQEWQRFGYVTISKILALQIQLAMTRFGRFVSITECNNGEYGFIEGRRVKIHIQYHGSIPSWNRTIRETRLAPSDEFNFYPRVCSVSASEYEGPVSNISVEGNPTFLVANLVTHNCEKGDCEGPAYQFEKMHPRILLRLERRPHYDWFRDWVII